MQKHSNLEEEVNRIVASMDEQRNNQEQDTNTQTPQDEIQDVYVLIVREQEEDHIQVVDSAPVKHKQEYMAFLPVCVFLLVIFSTFAFQLYCMMNPPIATVTIIPKSQTVTLSGTMQLGRVLNPITISQSQTTPTTGKGHQNATTAAGFITFYNGQFQSVTVAAGTIFTGNDGVIIVTYQSAVIPAGNPPTYGLVSVSAHAINAGVSGNIPAYDINQACCATSVLAKNTQPFYGGQDERTYTTVTQKDILSISTVLKTTLANSITGALQGQLKPSEQLQVLPCSPTVTSNHQPGDEATKVTVTVSETCSAVVYNSQELQTKATLFLVTQALHTTGAGYSLFGTVHISVTRASVSSTAHHLVFLSFKARGTWIYGLTHTAQEQIKHLIAGKTTQEAQNLLASLPGVKHAAIRLQGLGDATRLPKNSGYMYVTIYVV